MFCKSRHTLYLAFVLNVFLSVNSRKTYDCTGAYQGTPYCTYTEGDCQSRIIVNAPHGGSLKPPDVPVRKGGCFIDGKCDWRYYCQPKAFKKCEGVIEVTNDDNTRELSQHLVEYLTEADVRPHFIRNNLHRSRIDANRPFFESTYHYPTIMNMYEEYHKIIQKARSKIQGPGLYIEVHAHRGQPSKDALVIFGYNLPKKDFKNRTLSMIPGLTIKRLVKESPYSMENIIRGKESLGYIMSKNGYDSEPSPDIPDPSTYPGYYAGGYNIRKYGSADGKVNIDAIQVEVHKTHLTENDIKDTAKALASSITEWMKIHYKGLPKQNCDKKDDDD